MSEQVPEYYSDIFHVRTNPWGVALSFAVSAPKDGIEQRDICVVRVSHETAKAISMLLRRQLKTYERETRTMIAIPTKIMNEIGLAPEDW